MSLISQLFLLFLNILNAWLIPKVCLVIHIGISHLNQSHISFDWFFSLADEVFLNDAYQSVRVFNGHLSGTFFYRSCSANFKSNSLISLESLLLFLYYLVSIIQCVCREPDYYFYIQVCSFVALSKCWTNRRRFLVALAFHYHVSYMYIV